MSDPLMVACPVGTWTKVATNVLVGMIHEKDTKAHYLATYRDTGGAAPSDDGDEGVLAFSDADRALAIQSTAAIDVWIYAQTAAGRVRVDL
ncbi:hypothetical protein KAR91_19605 [Candidatus Pacearchaeota archaeon]|nr:hypothetical protein [Candidatus Pacearchaeota archaeon]